jgi:transposase InsO family protein
MGAGWCEMILRLRRCRLTAAEIACRLGLARSTVAAELARLGLGQLTALEPKAPVRRYERRRPGDLVHVDIKRLARFDKPGHRVTGSRVGQNSKLGFEYVHVCIDDHSRAAYVEVLEDETGDTCARFLARAVVWFAKQGITVRRVMTDNGVGYRSHLFRQAWQALGLRHLLTRPYTPQTNGLETAAPFLPPGDRPRPMAERFIKTMLQDWVYAVPYRSSDSRNRQLPRWLKHYNQLRPHSAIGAMPPTSRLARPVNNLLGLHS